MASTPGQRHSNVYAGDLDDTTIDVNAIVQRFTQPIVNGTVPFNRRREFLRNNQSLIEGEITNEYTNLYTDSMRGSYGAGIDQALDEMERLGLEDGVFNQGDVKEFQEIRKVNTGLYVSDARKDSRTVFNSMANWAAIATPETIAPFTFNFKSLKVVRSGSTIVNTQVNAFFRTTNFVISINAGVQRFIYRGPSPERPFCDRIVNKVFSLKEIQRLNNGQTSDVFATGGGFNCRHRFVPIAPVKNEPKQPTNKEADTRIKSLGVN